MIGRLKRLFMDLGTYFLSLSLVRHSLVVIFGISAWIGVNGLYVQLPLLVIAAPEGWNLSAYAVIMIQAANVGPVALTVARKFYPLINEALCISSLLLVGTLAMGSLAFLYDKTLYIGDEAHSIPMFICIFLSALVGCTSSVLFMPYLRNYEKRYLVSYFVGEGLSGAVPSLVAFFQGVGDNFQCKDYGNGTRIEIASEPNFSPRSYFISIFAVIFLSLCSFQLLRCLPSIEPDHPTSYDVCGTKNVHFDLEHDPSHEGNITGNDCERSKDDALEIKRVEALTFRRFVYFYGLLALMCFLANGFLPSVQTYSCLPYGNLAFHLTVTLTCITNPIACMLHFWIDSIRIKVIDGLTIVGAITCIWAIYLATTSPNPPLRNSPIGIVTVVLDWVLLTGIVSYLKLSITSKIREKIGPKALIGVGTVMQLGSACGAIVSFVLIKYTTLFVAYQPCAPL